MLEHLSNHEQTPRASDRGFGLVFAAFFLIVALVPLWYGHDVRLWAVGASFTFGFIALTVPALLARLNHLWTEFGQLLHRIIGPVALAILFYGVVTPTGLLMRFFGKDLLRLRFDREASSYWIQRTPTGPSAESLKNQF